MPQIEDHDSVINSSKPCRALILVAKQPPGDLPHTGKAQSIRRSIPGPVFRLWGADAESRHVGRRLGHGFATSPTLFVECRRFSVTPKHCGSYWPPSLRRLSSSKETTLPPPPPLRTGQISFPISGSSLSKRPCDGARPTHGTRGMMDLIVTGREQQHTIVRCVTAAMRASDLVVAGPPRERSDGLTTVRTVSLLASP